MGGVWLHPTSPLLWNRFGGHGGCQRVAHLRVGFLYDGHMIIAVGLASVFATGFVLGVVVRGRRSVDIVFGTAGDEQFRWDGGDWVVTGDVPPESTTETLR